MGINFVKENLWILILLVLWDLFWKGKALWKAAKFNQLYWFMALLLINSAGIVPIIYLKFFSSKHGKNKKGGV